MTKAAFALNPDNLPHRMTAAQPTDCNTDRQTFPVPFTPRGRWGWRQSLTADPP